MQVITVNPAVIVQTLMDTRILVVPTHVLQEVTVLLVLISQHLAIREPSEERLEVQHRTIAVPAKKDTTASKMILFPSYVIQVLSAQLVPTSLPTA